jgi:hypothetical protein
VLGICRPSARANGTLIDLGRSLPAALPRADGPTAAILGGMAGRKRWALGCGLALVAVAAANVAACAYLIPQRPDVAAIAHSPEVSAVRATALPAVDAAFASLEPGRPLGTAIQDRCDAWETGFFLPAWHRVTCRRSVIRYYGVDGESCRDVLRSFRRLGWQSLPGRCHGSNGLPHTTRVVPGATGRAIFQLFMSPGPDLPPIKDESRSAPSDEAIEVYLEHRAVERSELVPRILRDHSHIVAIKTEITYFDENDTEYTRWGPV